MEKEIGCITYRHFNVLYMNLLHGKVPIICAGDLFILMTCVHCRRLQKQCMSIFLIEDRFQSIQIVVDLLLLEVIKFRTNH